MNEGEAKRKFEPINNVD